MTIGELAAESGVAASTIRYWERVGVLPKAPRVSGQRRYSGDAVHWLAVLCLAQACGFTLGEMRHLLHGFTPGVSASRRWKEMVRKKQAELEAQIARLCHMRALLDRVGQCQCATLTECGRIAISAVQAANGRA